MADASKGWEPTVGAVVCLKPEALARYKRVVEGERFQVLELHEGKVRCGRVGKPETNPRTFEASEMVPAPEIVPREPLELVLPALLRAHEGHRFSVVFEDDVFSIADGDGDYVGVGKTLPSAVDDLVRVLRGVEG